MKHIKDIKLSEDFEIGKWDKRFNFEDFDDTDISGMRMEISIDELIADVKESIDRTIPKVGYPILKRSAVTEIKKLWKEKIDQWKVD